jgi:succinate dehydrogenase/fumarate reductase-like Fe-S protein
LIFFHNNVFCWCCETKDGVFFSVLQYFGPSEFAAKYRYKVEIVNNEDRESFVITRLVRSFLEDTKFAVEETA